MATLEQIGEALKRADAAGNADDARKLAVAYKAMQSQAAPEALAPAQPSPAPAQPSAGPMDFLTQGMSGLNEGIASGLGLPVDLATMALNAGSSGINMLTGSKLPRIENPVGGGESFRQMLAPTIKPETDDPAQQMTRRVAQEVGAMVIPGMGPVARSARPLVTAGKEMLAAAGSGTGAAVAQQVAPGNPLAELAGQLIGGASPGGLSRMATRAPKAATVADLRAATNAAYEKTRNMGVAYSPDAYDNMLVKLTKEATADGISATRHASAHSFIKDMIAARGKPLSLTEIDQLRQRVRRDLITPSMGNPEKAADAHFGQSILDNIDDMISTAKPSDMIAGNAKDAANAIIQARSLNTRMRKVEMLQEAVDKAKLAAAASGSGGNINNAIRQQIKNLLTNPRRSRGLTGEERAMLEAVVKGGKVENVLRLIGKLSPSGNGLMAALGIGGTVMNPLMAAAPAAGMAAKAISDRAVINKIGKVQAGIAGGPPPMPRPPFLPPDARAALTAAQLANQVQQPLQITVRGGAR